MLFFTFIYSICAFAVLGADAKAGEGFAAFWSMVMAISVAVGGTMVFRKYQTEAAVGFLLGMLAMMSQLIFLLFCVFASYAGEEEFKSVSTTDQTFATFAFFLFLSYVITAVGLFSFRADLLPQDNNVVSKPVVNTSAGPGGPVATVQV